MNSPKRIGMNVLDDELKGLFSTQLKIFPVDYALVESGSNPLSHEYIRVTTPGEFKNHVYVWDGDWTLIGADDNSISWVDVKGKPVAYNPMVHRHTLSEVDGVDTLATKTDLSSKANTTHTHTISEITDVGTLATKTDLNSKANTSHTHTLSQITDANTLATKAELTAKADTSALFGKVDKVSGKGLSSNDFTVDLKAKLESLSDSASVDYATVDGKVNNHISDTSVHVTSSEKNAIAAVPQKADKIYVDSALAAKIESTTFAGHTGNTSIHVTQLDKDTWNSKSNFSGSYADLTNKPVLFSGSYTDLTGKPAIPTRTSQLANDNGFITSAPDEITIGSTQPSTNLWYKVVG